MNITSTPISGLKIVDLTVATDKRGHFSKWFDCELLAPLLGSEKIEQANHSLTKNIGTVRGMHYQIEPYEELKIIRCIRGRVFDVAVDLRSSSESFLSWYGVELYEGDCKIIVIPKGCAHGFQVLEESSEMLYLHTAPYSQKFERGVRYNDPVLSINWPLKVSEISERDSNHPLIESNFSGV